MLRNAAGHLRKCGKIARVPTHCERSENNTITFAHLSHVITEFAGRNVAFTLKIYLLFMCCHQLSKQHTRIFELGAKIAMMLNRFANALKEIQ